MKEPEVLMDELRELSARYFRAIYAIRYSDGDPLDGLMAVKEAETLMQAKEYEILNLVGSKAVAAQEETPAPKKRKTRAKKAEPVEETVEEPEVEAPAEVETKVAPIVPEPVAEPAPVVEAEPEPAAEPDSEEDLDAMRQICNEMLKKYAGFNTVKEAMDLMQETNGSGRLSMFNMKELKKLKGVLEIALENCK